MPGPTRRIFNNWWSVTNKSSVHNIIIHIAPIFICWKIWKQWTNCKFGGQNKMYHKKMEYQIIWNITAALDITFPLVTVTGNWPNMCATFEILQPKVNVKQVIWPKPEAGDYKINVDGSYNKDTGQAGIRGIVRDSNGDFVMAFSKVVHCTSNNQTEATAARFGTQWCVQKGLNSSVMEMDSMVIINMLKNKGTANLNLKIIYDTNYSVINTSVDFNHCY